MIITISGMLSSGKSTVGKWLAEELGYEYYYSGGRILRDIAKKHNMSLHEFQEHAAKDPKWDLEIDKYQEDLGKTKDNIVLDGHLAFHFVPNSLKVFLDVDFEVALERRWKELQKPTDRNEGEFKDKDELRAALKKRIEVAKDRFVRYYNVDPYDKSNYDIVVDTSKLPIPKVERKVLEEVKKHSKVNSLHS
ncbi:MAG: cytidylate kinase family protein [archaeon]